MNTQFHLLDSDALPEIHPLLVPDADGFFGNYGGCFIPEILRGAIDDLTQNFEKIRHDETFWAEYIHVCRTFSNRPTPLTFAENITEKFGTARVYIKREDLNHTGAHKFNNVIGQALLARRLGKKRLIAETGAGQHGVATATAAAKFGLACTIYMGAEDVARQYPNVFWMKQLGAQVVPVSAGTATLKDAINEAMRDWSTNPDETHYLLGTACGPHPFPQMLAFFHSVIGSEARKSILAVEKRLPTAVYACVGGGSNALGLFSGFLGDDSVDKVGVEAGGLGVASGRHAVRFGNADSKIGIAQGYKTRFLQNSDGQMRDTYSISAGLDYIGVSPIVAHLHDIGKIRIALATDREVMQAVELFIRNEGLVPALESAHAFAAAVRELPRMQPDDVIIISQSGRADKDIFTVAEAIHDTQCRAEWEQYVTQKAEHYRNKIAQA